MYSLPNWRTIIPKKFLHLCESSTATTYFPTWGSSKGNKNLQRIWLWRPVGFDYRTSKGQGKQILGGIKQNIFVHQDPGERSSDSTKEWARHGCRCPGISSGGMDVKGYCWTMKRCQDPWPLEAKNSIRGQRWGFITQSFCETEFY